MEQKGLTNKDTSLRSAQNSANREDFVLDKHIFSNVFEKDIRRIYIYKKAERIAKALYLIAPAFKDIRTLRERLERISLGLIDASILSPLVARERIAQELLTLSSVLEMAKVGGTLSAMNADIISREAQSLLQEVAGYEDPRIYIEEVPSLSVLNRASTRGSERSVTKTRKEVVPTSPTVESTPSPSRKDGSQRQEALLSVLDKKGPSSIKDISLLMRDIGEKTIQRELKVLVQKGVVTTTGSRRWTVYALKRG